MNFFKKISFFLTKSHSWTPPHIKHIIMKILVLSHAQPAEFIIAHGTSHVVTSVDFLD
jgi:hypothetical protein